MPLPLPTINIVASQMTASKGARAIRPRWRVSARLYRWVTVAALVALAVIVVTGAAVRLTGSGLGCTDWPTCEEGQFFAELDNVHAMVEFLNRLFTGVVSLAVILAVLGSLLRLPRRRDLTWLSLGLVAGVLAQIVWGGFTVWSKLRPEMVMGHYLISAVLLADAAVLVQRAATGGAPIGLAVPRKVLTMSRIMVALSVVVIVTGTVVTNTGPHAGDENAVRFSFDITSVARIHAISVMVFAAVGIATLYLAYRSTPSSSPTGVTLRRRGGLLVGVVVAQAAIGYIQFFTGVPATLVGIHVFGSVLTLLAVMGVHLAMVERPPLEQPEPQPAIART
jgi:cytochrome c oxidase assembly protein subunit 15